jgi:aspartate/methionine/tyrosine aminotransferase
VAACVGTKEFVAGIPQWLQLRTPARDTVLYPAISYPTYAMGALLAGCRAVAYESIEEIRDDDAERALCLWVNTPANPSGEVIDLEVAAHWGRARRIPVLSDECYVEFTWRGAAHSILEHGTTGVIAVHSLSKRSNLAGLRVGFYAGDRDLVDYLRELRKHAGFMVAGPIQAAAVVALDDDVHVDEQRARYLGRLQRLRDILRIGLDLEFDLPAGAFYLWVPAPGGDAWGLTKRLAIEAGTLVSPGEFYGPAGAGHVRIAVVQPDERIELIAQRLGVS